MSSGSGKRKRGLVPENSTDEQQQAVKRLTTACTECRKQKIKCELQNDEPPCSRCQRRGLSCVLHTPFRHAGPDLKQFSLVSRDVNNLHAVIERLCQRLDMDPPPPLFYEQDPDQDQAQQAVQDDPNDEGICELSPPASPSTLAAPMDTYLTSAQSDGSPLASTSQDARRRSVHRSDIISKAIVTAEQAEVLVQRYLSRYDRFIYGIASRYSNTEEIRRASPALLAAICTVSAFQDAEHRALFDSCNREYRRIVSSSLFEKRDVEYIRALCIGSFWLPDASRILISDAIRRAADCRLQQNFYHLTGTGEGTPTQRSLDEAKDRVALFYLLFVCDQHLSILHNRDCIMRAERVVEGRDQFLIGDKPKNQDVRLLSQVSLLSIMGQIREMFGDEQAISKTQGIQFQHFTRELDRWFARFSPIFEPDTQIGGFPLAGLKMHYQFSKLYLGHHIFRGLLRPFPSSPENAIPVSFLPIAATTHQAATTIFHLVSTNSCFNSHLVGMPHYFHIMISFAGHFLLQLYSNRYREQLGLDLNVIEDSMRQMGTVIGLFLRAGEVPERHPVRRVAIGLGRRLKEVAGTLGLDGNLIGSPFERLNTGYAALRGSALQEGSGLGAGMMSSSSNNLDWQTQGLFQSSNGEDSTILQDEFLFPDFGDLTTGFADTSHFNFL